MQVQIKRQLKIELDQSDITIAVANYLAANGYSINQTDLEKINYVKSPKDGLRAELNITEETGVEAEADSIPPNTPVEYDAESRPAVTNLEAKTTAIDGKITTVGDAQITTTVTRIPAAAVEPEPEVEDDEPGVIAASTVEDVMPSVSEMKAIVEATPEPEPVNPEPEPVATEAAPRTKLFM